MQLRRLTLERQGPRAVQPPRVPNFLRLPIDGLANNAHPLGQRHYLHPPATRLSALPNISQHASGAHCPR
jgi:hypothetical protein